MLKPTKNHWKQHRAYPKERGKILSLNKSKTRTSATRLLNVFEKVPKKPTSMSPSPSPKVDSYLEATLILVYIRLFERCVRIFSFLTLTGLVNELVLSKKCHVDRQRALYLDWSLTVFRNKNIRATSSLKWRAKYISWSQICRESRLIWIRVPFSGWEILPVFEEVIWIPIIRTWNNVSVGQGYIRGWNWYYPPVYTAHKRTPHPQCLREYRGIQDSARPRRQHHTPISHSLLPW